MTAKDPNRPRCNGLRRRKHWPEHLQHKDFPRVGWGPWAEPHGVYCGKEAGWDTEHKGEGRCCLHGGRSLRGRAHPGFEHGGWAKDTPKTYRDQVPPKYRDGYDAAINDPVAQREHSRQLSVIHAMEGDLLERMGTGESGEAWARVQEVGREVRGLIRDSVKAEERGAELPAAMARGEALDKVDGELLPLIEHGAGEERSRQEYVDLVQRRSKLIRVQQQGERTVPVEVLGVLVARLAAIQSEVITKKVKDPKAARDILNALITRTRVEALPGGGEGMMRRVDSHTAQREIEGRLKDGAGPGDHGDSADLPTIEATSKPTK